MVVTYLGLGGNIGDRESYILAALEGLQQLKLSRIVALSPIYETKAWGLENQSDFLNLVVCLETELSAQDLLVACQELELALDRKRVIHWGPRTIDIDILTYGEENIDLPDLKIPHPYIAERAFVLFPFSQLAPHLVLPGYCQTIAELAQTSDRTTIKMYACLSSNGDSFDIIRGE